MTTQLLIQPIVPCGSLPIPVPSCPPVLLQDNLSPLDRHKTDKHLVKSDVHDGR